MSSSWREDLFHQQRITRIQYTLSCLLQNTPAEKTELLRCVTRVAPDQPVHWCSLIGDYTVSQPVNTTLQCYLYFIRRIMKVTKPTVVTCNFKSFSNKSYRLSHMQVHTGEVPYTCNVCDKSFSRYFNLSKHIQTHTGELPYTCNVCDNSFSQSSSLARHMRTHTVLISISRIYHLKLHLLKVWFSVTGKQLKHVACSSAKNVH